ncbi:hypothetical protein AB1N83_001613 [Pleurotus pulmonarius]|nr:hypothetical protein EYR38_008694 [Pleurotus pulmonarius]
MLAAHAPAAQKKVNRARLVSDSSRAEFRKLRQIEIEKEQKLEELEALQKLMDKSEHENLVKALSSVKTEFSDLDGIKWTRFRRQRPTPLSRLNTASVPTLSIHSFPERSSACTLSDATTDFAPIKDPRQRTGSEGNTFSHDDTIRVSSARWRYRTQLPSSGHSPLSQTFSESQSNLSAPPTPRHDVLSSNPSADSIVHHFKPSGSDHFVDSDEETICVPIQQLLNTRQDTPLSSSPSDDNTETIRGIPMDQGTIRAYSSQKTSEMDARPMVGRVFCREYERSPDGKRKPGTPGRWHAVEGLRVDLSS